MRFSLQNKFLRKTDWLNEIATSHKTLLAMTDLEWFVKTNHIKKHRAEIFGVRWLKDEILTSHNTLLRMTEKTSYTHPPRPLGVFRQ